MVKNKKYPLRLSYASRTALWAGDRLSSEYKKGATGEKISETWELSVREDAMSRILNGSCEGMTLEQYFEREGYDCVSNTFDASMRFPLLVKLIDAADTLSVQVHPRDEDIDASAGDSGKTEMWYIVDAEPDAKIIYGLKNGVGREELELAIAERRLPDIMNYVSVSAGQTYFIPAGTVHALGAGIVVAEIQQSSDRTYRLYDFERRDEQGNLRELHIDKALSVTRRYSGEDVDALRYKRGRDCRGGELLASSEYFKVRRVTLRGEWQDSVTEESFVSVLCLDGDGAIVLDGERYPVSKGDSYFLPAGMGEYALDGEMTVILSEI